MVTNNSFAAGQSFLIWAAASMPLSRGMVISRLAARNVCVCDHRAARRTFQRPHIHQEPALFRGRVAGIFQLERCATARQHSLYPFECRLRIGHSCSRGAPAGVRIIRAEPDRSRRYRAVFARKAIPGFVGFQDGSIGAQHRNVRG